MHSSSLGKAVQLNDKMLPYEPEQIGVGIVHIGLGAFHRAHQAWYTHNALSKSNGDWRITAVSMRSQALAHSLEAQDGLYFLEECDAEGATNTLVGSIAHSYSLRDKRRQIVEALAHPDCKIITLTVTEKAYHYDPEAQGIVLDHPDIQEDLEELSAANTVPGLLVHTMNLRRQTGKPGLTILCCDNLPHNGRVVRAVTLTMAEAVDPELAAWIEINVAFPSSMVDRITPAVTEEFARNIEVQTGYSDKCAVRTERFSQWVIEDDFPRGRPAWERAGAVMTSNVGPYEEMKLRMLNGSHSLLAYAGFVSEHPTIKSCMENPVLRALLRRHLRSTAATLKPLPDFDYDDYAEALIDRFDNPNIAHSTFQIAMDGSQKMRQRIFTPTKALAQRGMAYDTYAFATAAWLRYTSGKTESGDIYRLQDPLEKALISSWTGTTTPQEVLAAIGRIDGLIPQTLAGDPRWKARVTRHLGAIQSDGMIKAAQALLDG